MVSILFSSCFVMLCAILFLQAGTSEVHGFLGATSLRLKRTTSSTSQLSMAWTLPTPTRPSFQPSWYQDCGNPTARRVVYDDYLDGEEEPTYEFSFSDYGRDWSSSLDSETKTATVQEQTSMPRGARISRVARRAFQGLRNTLRP